MVSFVIDFDNPERKYIAGETIRVKVKITIFSKFKARSLSIRWKGFAHTEWRESRNVTDSDGKTRTEWDTFSSHEEYFNNRQYFFRTETEVVPGTYYYDAVYRLLTNIPSSFEHDNGHIRYDVKVKYDIPWSFDKDHSASFYVTSKYDLNEFPQLRDPYKSMREKTFGCCCWESDPMYMMNILPKKGFVPGENIPISIQIDNNSDVTIESVQTKLEENITFIARGPHTDRRYDNNTIKRHVFRTPVLPYQNKILQTDFFLDPHHNFKIFNGCGIITSNYHIESEAIASGCHSNLDNTTTITIGTVPFSDHVSNGNLPPVIHVIPTAPVNDDGVVIEQPLPSYDQVASNLPSTFGFGWNLNPKAPLASTEKINLDDDLPPPSFEDSQKDQKSILKLPGSHVPTAPLDPTTSATAPPE